MTFGQFLSVMRARWWVVLGVLAAIVGATVAVSWSMPRQYTASASFLLDIKPDPVSAVVYGGLPSPAFMATQVDIIKSDSVGLRVARNTKLGENPQVRQQWLEASEGQGSIEQWLVDVFRRQLEVLPSRESNVITVSYKASDPRSAAAMANAFVEAYMQISLELRVDPARQYSSFFDTRAKEAREALEKAQNRLSEFQKEKGITSAEERLDIENARLNELSSQLVSLQAVAAESSSRQAQAISTQGDRLPEVLNNAVVSGLKADIGRAEAHLPDVEPGLVDAAVGQIFAEGVERQRTVARDPAQGRRIARLPGRQLAPSAPGLEDPALVDEDHPRDVGTVVVEVMAVEQLAPFLQLDRGTGREVNGGKDGQQGDDQGQQYFFHAILLWQLF